MFLAGSSECELGEFCGLGFHAELFRSPPKEFGTEPSQDGAANGRARTKHYGIYDFFPCGHFCFLGFRTCRPVLLAPPRTVFCPSRWPARAVDLVAGTDLPSWFAIIFSALGICSSARRRGPIRARTCGPSPSACVYRLRPGG